MRVLSYITICSFDCIALKRVFYWSFINCFISFICFQIKSQWWTQNTIFWYIYIFFLFEFLFTYFNVYRIKRISPPSSGPFVFFHIWRIPVVYLDRNAEKIRHVRSFRRADTRKKLVITHSNWEFSIYLLTVDEGPQRILRDKHQLECDNRRVT